MLDGERIPGKFSPVEPLNRVGTARCAVRAAFSGATIPPAVSRAGTSQRDVPTAVGFMGRVLLDCMDTAKVFISVDLWEFRKSAEFSYSLWPLRCDRDIRRRGW